MNSCMTTRSDVSVFDKHDEQLRRVREETRFCVPWTVKLDGKRKQTAVALHGAVASLAWDACESLADTPEQLEADGACGHFC